MRTFFYLIVSFFVFSDCYSQEKLADSFPFKDGLIVYSDVIQVDSILKEELYNKAKRWIIDTFNSGKDVLQLDSKENGEIITKGYFSAYWKISSVYVQDVKVWQTLRIQVKDNRFKYELYDFRLKYYVNNTGDVDSSLEEWITNWDKPLADQPRAARSMIPGIRSFLLGIDPKVHDQISSLVTAMKIKAKEDW